VLDVHRRSQRQVRLVNVYDVLQQSDMIRLACEVDWSRIITTNTIFAGDFNTHSPRWNPQCSMSSSHLFLEGLIDEHDLLYVGDGKATHWQTGQLRHSVIDMVFSTMELEPHVTASRLDDPAHATSSDHAAIWSMVDMGIQTADPQLISWGCAVGEWLDNTDSMRVAEQEWCLRCSDRPLLDDIYTAAAVQEEAEWLHRQLM
jgi:hypothetical protein